MIVSKLLMAIALFALGFTCFAVNASIRDRPTLH